MSWGLEGMRERALLLGGQFILTSRPGEGTQVEMVLPYEKGDSQYGNALIAG